MAVVARRAPAHNDREACDLARSATVAQLRVGLSKHFVTHPAPAAEPADPADPAAGSSDQAARRADAAPGSGSPDAAPAEHRLACGFDDDGDFFLHGLANGVDGAVIHQALTEAKDALFREGHTDATWLDALVEVSKRSLDTVGSVSRRQLFKVIVHLDTNGSWIHRGPAVPPSLMDRLTCDGVIQPLSRTEGHPINLGRAQHIVPLRTYFRPPPLPAHGEHHVDDQQLYHHLDLRLDHPDDDN